LDTPKLASWWDWVGHPLSRPVGGVSLDTPKLASWWSEVWTHPKLTSWRWARARQPSCGRLRPPAVEGPRRADGGRRGDGEAGALAGWAVGWRTGHVK
jgi:hypothetical protein